MSASLKVRVAIPHYFQELPGKVGYGSSRQGAAPGRSLALSRCLNGLLQLERAAQDLVLNHSERHLDVTNSLHGISPIPQLQLEIHVFTTGDHCLNEALTSFGSRIQRHSVTLDNPRNLALATRDFLVQHPEPLDLALYLEDDLVISDPLFLDKQAWFLSRSQHQAVLMPHRYELLPDRHGQRLLVDGPLDAGFINTFQQPMLNASRGRFWDGQEISFDRPANPHSGLFCLSKFQLERLQQTQLPREGFISPLETAATLTALAEFSVLKPSLNQRNFLWVEHGYPSFISYVPPLNEETK